MNPDLTNLYVNRNLLIFTHGRDWFIEQANKLMPKSYCRISTVDEETNDWMNSPDFQRLCWECENDLTPTEELETA